MAAHLPFVNTRTDCQLVTDLYADSEFVRVPLEKIDELQPMLPDGPRLWIDSGVDGFHREFGPITSEDEKREEQRRKEESEGNKTGKMKGKKWREHMRRFPKYERLADRTFQSKPLRSQVEEFVAAVLDECMKHAPALITVPQLPLVNDVSRNKINRALAAATEKWKAGANYRGKLILPAVFTNQKQLNLKAPRAKKESILQKCYEEAEADGLWSVDSSLSDQSGSPTLREKRFPGLLAFHEEMAERLPDGAITIAGPYWGMNLVLWARGLCDYPAIGLGSAYQYFISGPEPSASNVRVALPPLRRWVQTGADLRNWLSRVVDVVNTTEKAHTVFMELKANHSNLAASKRLARHQIAQFYKEWCDELESAPPAARALTLFQMLSSAYVLGKTLPTISATEKTARRPERIAEYLMLNCL